MQNITHGRKTDLVFFSTKSPDTIHKVWRQIGNNPRVELTSSSFILLMAASSSLGSWISRSSGSTLTGAMVWLVSEEELLVRRWISTSCSEMLSPLNALWARAASTFSTTGVLGRCISSSESEEEEEEETLETLWAVEAASRASVASSSFRRASSTSDCEGEGVNDKFMLLCQWVVADFCCCCWLFNQIFSWSISVFFWRVVDRKFFQIFFLL